jgi:DNA end-binding protein Ku
MEGVDMAPRAVLHSSISFGLVSIPVELYPAIQSKAVHFNLLHEKDNSRIQEKIYCVAEGKQIDRKELVHGYQIQKGKYVGFSSEELKKLEAAASREIDIIQFVPIAQVDPVYFVASYLLAKGSGAANAYNLLHAAMKKSDRAAVAKFVMRGREHLALIRPYGNALILHTMHYADEIRSTEQVGSNKAKAQASELKLAERLIDDLSKDRFDPEKFEDTYRTRILNTARQKAAGHEIELPPAPKESRTVDLMAALKKSLEERTQTQSGRKDMTERPRSQRVGKIARRESHTEKRTSDRSRARA